MTVSHVANEDLVRIGTLALALYNASDADVEILGSKLAAEMDRLNRIEAAGGALVMLAKSLLSGQPYLIVSNSDSTVARARSLAAHLGATVTEQEPKWGIRGRCLRVDPADRAIGLLLQNRLPS